MPTRWLRDARRRKRDSDSYTAHRKNSWALPDVREKLVALHPTGATPEKADTLAWSSWSTFLRNTSGLRSAQAKKKRCYAGTSGNLTPPKKEE